jgi:BspA type Leucine rich repeat region (6 copies)/Hint domain
MCDISIPSVLANSLGAEFAYEPNKSVYTNNNVNSSTSTYITPDASIFGGISLTGFSTSADIGYGVSGTYYMQVETTQSADSWAYIWAANANNNAIFLFNAYHGGGTALALGNIGVWDPNSPSVLTNNTTYYLFITFSKVDSNSIVTLKVYNSSKEKIIDMTETFPYSSSLEGTGNVQLGVRGGGMPYDYFRYYRFAFFRSSLSDSQISDILTNDSYKNATTATAIGGGGGSPPPPSFTTNGSGTITGYSDNTATSLTIPASVNGETITAIGDNAFNGWTTLTSVIFAANPLLVSIGIEAFKFTHITSISIPDSVTSIDRKAFHYCTLLQSINLPTGLTTLGAGALQQCSALTSINLPSGITRIEDSLFVGCSLLTELTIPSGVTFIGGSAINVTHIASLTIPASVTGIAYNGLVSSYLVSVAFLGEFNALINSESFEGNSALMSITVPTLSGSWATHETYFTGFTITAAAAPPTPADTAVAGGPNEIGAYIVASSASTPTLMNEMRSAINTLGGSDAQKAAAKVEYIAAMNAKVGGDAISIPWTGCAALVATLTSQTPNIQANPIAAFFPDFSSTSVIIDITSVSTSQYLFIEVPIGYSITLTNNGASKTLLFNGTNYTSGSSTYGLASPISIGNKVYTILGTGSILGGVEDNNDSVQCFVAGTKVLTAAGYKAVETLASSDKIVTADGRTVAFNLYSTHVKSATKETAPYVIPANTFGSKSPAADLTLSPLHAIQSRKGVWQIPKYAALTHSAIYQVCLGEQVTYYHVELPNFFTDNIVAEGTVVESYGLKQTKGMKNVYKFNTSLNGFTRISNAKTTVRK